MDSRALIELQRQPFRKRLAMQYSVYLKEVEKGFMSGDYEKSIEFIANPHLFKNVHEIKAAIDTWPLSNRTVINGLS